MKKHVLTALLIGLMMSSLSLGNAGAEEKKEQQFNLVSPAELQALRAQAAAGLDARSKETLRHMYTAAALTGILANSNSGYNNHTVVESVELAKSYGYAMIAAQEKDEKKREVRAKTKESK